MTFYAGQTIDRGRLKFRVTKGDRCEGDLVLHFAVKCDRCGADCWHTPKIELMFISAAFKAQVEENNYGAAGKITAGKGWWKLAEKLSYVLSTGDWEGAAAETESEANNAKQRRMAKQATP